jgi:uncharacterized membrane protein
LAFNPAVSLMSEAISYLLLALFLFSGYHILGGKITLLFLAGSLFWTLPLESFGVLMSFFSYEVQTSPYVYPRYLIWAGVVPFWISIGWFDVTFPAYHFSRTLLAKHDALVASLVGGLIAVNMDLLIDPAATSSHLWRWTHDSFYLFGVPVTNYVGWFLLSSLFLLVFDVTVIKRQHFKFLTPIERVVCKRSQNIDSSFRNLIVTFFFRLFVFQLVFIGIYVPLLMSISRFASMVG